VLPLRGNGWSRKLLVLWFCSCFMVSSLAGDQLQLSRSHAPL